MNKFGVTSYLLTVVPVLGIGIMVVRMPNQNTLLDVEVEGEDEVPEIP